MCGCGVSSNHDAPFRRAVPITPADRVGAHVGRSVHDELGELDCRPGVLAARRATRAGAGECDKKSEKPRGLWYEAATKWSRMRVEIRDAGASLGDIRSRYRRIRTASRAQAREGVTVPSRFWVEIDRRELGSRLSQRAPGWLACTGAQMLQNALASCARARNPAAGNPEPPGRAAKPNWEVRLLGWRPMAADHSNLELVVRHIAEERRIVARQRELIARLRAAGALTSGAEETLKAFEANLAIFEERERALRRKG